MAPPLDIEIKSNDSNSVYNHLNQWTNLVKEQGERNVVTREVLFEKHQPLLLLKKQRQQTINKWASSGLLDGLTGARNENISQLLENQSRQLINQSMPIGISSRGFGEVIQKTKVEKTFLSKIKSFFVLIWKKLFKKKEKLIAYDIVTEPGFNTSGFDTIAFPMVRQVFAQTIAMDLVQVQPLDLPKGLLFYMDLPERENVFNRIVIFEKYKEPTYSKYQTQSMGRNYRYYAGIDVANDNDVATNFTITFPPDITTLA